MVKKLAPSERCPDGTVDNVVCVLASAGSAVRRSRGTAGATGTGGTYSYAQAEEIANARADRAEKAALASYFKQQGMSEAEITAAIHLFQCRHHRRQ